MQNFHFNQSGFNCLCQNVLACPGVTKSGNINRSLTIQYRFHTLCESIRKGYSIQIPVAIIISGQLYREVFVILQCNCTRLICYRIHRVMITIQSISIAMYTILRIIWVGHFTCIVPGGGFILNIFFAAYHFRTCCKPCFLQMQSGFCPDDWSILIVPIVLLIQRIPVCIVLVPLAHNQFVPIPIISTGFVFYRLRQFFKIVCGIDLCAGCIAYCLLIVCSRCIIVHKCPVLTAINASIVTRSGNIGDCLIQELPHIHLGVLIRTETNIVNQKIHIHLYICI